MKVEGQVESACEKDDIKLEDDKGPEDEHDVLLVVEFGFGVEFAVQADFGYHEESGEWLIIVRFGGCVFECPCEAIYNVVAIWVL